MANGGYWNRPGRGRLSRRDALRTAAIGLGGVAFAAACSGSNSNTGNSNNVGAGAKPSSSATTASGAGTAAAAGTPGSAASAAAGSPAAKLATPSSPLLQRTDTSAKAVPGSIYQSYTTADATNLDPLSSPSFTANVVGAYMYPRLIQFKPGIGVPAIGEVAPGFAESWEQPEPTRLVLHLRKNAVWDKRAPTSGRPVDADDVIFSWNKLVDKSISRKEIANSTNPQAPLASITAIDKNTVEVKAAFPYGPLLNSLAFGRYLHIMPRESEGGFDPRNDTRGFGPWILSNYQRSVKFEYRKNPDYYIKDRPFLDGFDYPIIPEYASALAQFRAKKLWSYGGLRQEDVVATKKDLPELLLDQNALDHTDWLIYFGLQPGSPFLDDRVRRAVSMLIDRDTWVDTFYNVSDFKKANYPTDISWHSHISSGYAGIWVDPKSKDIGEGAANFAFNQSEAKKLLTAAGFPNGIDTEFRYISTGEYGSLFPKYCEVFKGMLEDGGQFKLQQINPDYQTEYLPKIYYGKGDFKGIAVGASTEYPDVDGYMFAYYHTQGPRQKVAFMAQGGDAKSDGLIEAQRKELDFNKRIAIIKEWQSYMATKFLMVPFPGQATTYSLYWPWIGNVGVYRAYQAETSPDETLPMLWFDKSKFTG